MSIVRQRDNALPAPPMDDELADRLVAFVEEVRTQSSRPNAMQTLPVPTVNPIHWQIQPNRVMLVLDDEHFRADFTRLDWTVALEGGASG